MLKKSFYILVWFFLFITNSFAVSNVIKDWILKWIKADNTVIDNVEWKEWIESIFNYTKNTIFDLLALIVIWVFLYIWYKIIISKGNPEEFKKAFMMLIYAVLWMLFVALAWVIVVFISGLKI
jgi:hypothetical protein